MARYHFRDVEDQRAERAHDVRQWEIIGELSDFDRRPPLDELVDYEPFRDPKPRPGRVTA